MASVPITDVNSIILVSNTLSTLTSKPNEINLNSAVNINHIKLRAIQSYHTHVNFAHFDFFLKL